MEATARWPFKNLNDLGDGLGGRPSVDHTIGVLQGVLTNFPKTQDADELGSPGELTVELYPHQRYGLTWLWFREQHTPHGGILADETRLGKTLMILALCCRGMAKGKEDDETHGSPLNGTIVSSRGTLVICPLSALEQWKLEVKKSCPSMNVLKYHGKKRPKTAVKVAQHDLVITTFETVRSEVTDLADCGSPLIKIHWERIVLDEGHQIKNPTTETSRSACRLNARHRWIVTGRPVHNKPEDMFSLVKFLRLEPFDNKKTWESWIGTKLSKKVESGKESVERLKTIAKSLMLRRTKDEVSKATIQGAPGLQVIPAKTVLDIRVTLKPEEKKIYDHLFSSAREALLDYIKSKENGAGESGQGGNGRRKRGGKAQGGAKSYMSILAWVFRLRQCAVLPYLISTAIDKSEDISGEFDPVRDLMSFKNPVFSPNFQSAKLDKVYEDLDSIKRKCEIRKEPMEKIVIVSQWTTLLEVVQDQLTERGYTTARICKRGKGRETTAKEFNENPNDPQILLLSLVTEDVNLRLTGGSHLVILDLPQNPQWELRAHDRLHSFGQTKPVTIHRYISTETVEEEVVNLQKIKLEFTRDVIENCPKKDTAGFSLDDVRHIFGLETFSSCPLSPNWDSL